MLDIADKAIMKQPVYGYYIYRGEKYGLGLNYRGERKDFVNRMNVGFMSDLLIPFNDLKMFEISFSLGHEWYSKKAKWWYYGTEVYFGKCKYEYGKNKNYHYLEHFTEGGPVVFTGLKLNIKKKLEIRTEFNLIGKFWKRETLYDSKQRFAISSNKQLSLELYYKF